MKKFITTLALLTATVSFVYFTAFSEQKTSKKPVNYVMEEVPYAVPVSEIEYGYGEAPLGKPVFEFGAIKLKSGGICGAVTLIPKPGRAVQVRSQRFVKSYRGMAAKPSKILSKWTDLDQGGMRVKYDHAGRAQDYYKIFCRLQGSDRNIECRRVLIMQHFQQGHCGWGPGSVDASYAPLNMSVKNR
jgi:hypothetical protein